MAHDTGTGGDKAVLTDLRGRIVDSAYQAYGLNYPRPDWAEQDPGLSERDETAEICRDADGNPEPAPELRDIENVPLKQDVVASFRRVAGPRASRKAMMKRGTKAQADERGYASVALCSVVKAELFGGAAPWILTRPVGS